MNVSNIFQGKGQHEQGRPDYITSNTAQVNYINLSGDCFPKYPKFADRLFLRVSLPCRHKH